MSTPKLARLTLAVLGLLAGPALADTGTLHNNLDFPLTYQVGVPDQNGFVAWESHTLAPCASHEWSWPQGGEPNLRLAWPRWVDSRRDGNGNIINEVNAVRMGPNGSLSIFFRVGDQIWIDVTGANPCAGAAATPGTGPAGPAVATPSIGRIELRANFGQGLVTADLRRIGAADWEWLEGGARFTFRTVSETATEIIIHDPSRDMYHRVDFATGRTYWRLGAGGPWMLHMEVVLAQ